MSHVFKLSSIYSTMLQSTEPENITVTQNSVCNCVFCTGTFISNFLQNNIKTNQLEINTDIKTFRTTAKLKEPRDLFALPKELDCPQQAPRWPSECQVSFKF